MGKVRCVVVDIDDTLYLEREYVRSGFRAVARHLEEVHRAPGAFDLLWREFSMGRRGDTFDRALRELGLSEHLVPELVTVYREHAPEISLLPDARAFLERLRGERLLAAVSDGPLASQSKKAARLELERWCEPVVLTASLGGGFGKPHPRAFRLIELTLGVSGDTCVYVADNPLKDFRGPAELGWHTIRVRREGGLHEALPSGADVRQEVRSLEGVELP